MSEPSADGLDPARPPGTGGEAGFEPPAEASSTPRPPVPPPLPRHPSRGPRRRAARRSRRTLWIVLAIVGLPVLLLLGIVALGGLYLLTAREVPVLPSDREVVVSREYLEEWFDIATDEKYESFTKTRYIDDSYEVFYEYEDDEVYIDTTVSVEPTRGDAVAGYLAASTSASFGIETIGGVELIERNELLKWGEKSSCYLIGSEGEPFGNLFICLEGKKVFYLALSGCYFSEPDAFGQFLSPVLEKLKGYSPSP